MEEGFIVDRGDHSRTAPSSWVEGPPERSFWQGTKTRGKAQFQIVTYRCQKCGLLRSYAPAAPGS